MNHAVTTEFTASTNSAGIDGIANADNTSVANIDA